MGRGITLTRSEPVFLGDSARNDGWRLVITATRASLMPLEIFVHHRSVLNARSQLTASEFTSVASPVGLTSIPVDEPGELDYPPLYRSATIDVIVPSTAMALLVWQSVVDETNNLVDALDRMDRIQEIETVRCGDQDEESSS